MRILSVMLLTLCPGVPGPDPVVREMHAAAQAWRGRYGLPEQHLDARLCDLAQQQAEYMARYEWYAHGPHDQIIHRGPATARGAVDGWMGSGSHAAWMLSGNRRCGWGHAVSARGTHYWCGVFR